MFGMMFLKHAHFRDVSPTSDADGLGVMEVSSSQMAWRENEMALGLLPGITWREHPPVRGRLPLPAPYIVAY